MPFDFPPMPPDEGDQQRVHGTVPRPAYKYFKTMFPQHGAIQFAIRLVMEALPRMIEMNTVYRDMFIEQMEKMYAADRAEFEKRARPPVDPRQIPMFDVPEPKEL